jgi:hypothetical protein
VQDRLASRALFRAKLLAGEMPREIEEVFAECGTPLFPRSPADLDMHCSCPDWEVPCKHLAAVCYVLAEEFDRDPFGMLAWRGQGRDDLLAALRRIQAGSGQAGSGQVGLGQEAADQGFSPARPGLDVPGPPLEECLDGFWSPGLSPARLRALATAPDTAAPAGLLAAHMFPPCRWSRLQGVEDLAGRAGPAVAGSARPTLAVAAAERACLALRAAGRGPRPEHGLRQVLPLSPSAVEPGASPSSSIAPSTRHS